MKKLNITLLAILLTTMFTLAGIAQSHQTRAVSNFNAIASNGPFNVKVKINGTESVSVEADEDIINEIETVVEDNTLKIRWKKPHEWHHDIHKADVYVTAKDLSALINNGSGNINVEGSVNSNHLSTVLNGSGNITASVKSGNLEAAIHGSGSIKLNGVADDASIAVSGSGQLYAKELKTQSAAVSISGSGNVYVTAEKNITGSIAGSGNVIYSGSATATSHTAGSGRVRKEE